MRFPLSSIRNRTLGVKLAVLLTLILTAILTAWPTAGMADPILLQKLLIGSERIVSDAFEIIPDINGDGVLDIAAGTQSITTAPIVYLYSGKDFTELPLSRKLTDHNARLDYYGYITHKLGQTLAVADFNGDGVPDFATLQYGSHGMESGSWIQVVSGKDASLISNDFSSRGEIFSARDLNGDGAPELVTMSIQRRDKIIFSVVNPKNGTLRCTESVPLSELGIEPALVVVGDLTGDGVRDVVVADDGYNSNSGILLVFSGSDCKLQKSGKYGPRIGSVESHLGWHLKPLPDINGDHVEDLWYQWNGHIEVLSGADLTTVTTLDVSLDHPVYSGFSLSVAGDVGGDGIVDFGVIADVPNHFRDHFEFRSSSPLLNHQKLGSLPTELFKLPIWSEVHWLHLVTNPGYDINGDGIPDTLVVSSDSPDEKSPVKQVGVTVLNGACPRQVQSELVRPFDGDKVAFGKTVVGVQHKACGTEVPGNASIIFGGKEIPLNDGGQNGDDTAGDLIYSGYLDIAPGNNPLAIVGSPIADVPRLIGGTSNIIGTQNYQVAKATYEWESVDGASSIQEFNLRKEATLTFPFPITFYGEQVKDAIVYPSSVIELVGNGEYELPNLQKWEGARLPDPNSRAMLIAPLWGGAQADSSNNSHLYKKTVGPTGSRRFILTFEDLRSPNRSYDKSVSSRFDFQVIFYEGSPAIKFNYKRAFSTLPLEDRGAMGSIGVQSGPFLGITYAHHDPVLANESAITFFPVIEEKPTTPPVEVPPATLPPAKTEPPVVTDPRPPTRPDSTTNAGTDPATPPTVATNQLQAVRLQLSATTKRTTVSISLGGTTGELKPDTLAPTCSATLLVGQGINTAGLKYKSAGSVPLRALSSSITLAKLPTKVRVQATQKRKISVAARIAVECPGQPPIYSNALSLKTGESNVTPLGWAQRVVKAWL